MLVVIKRIVALLLCIMCISVFANSAMAAKKGAIKTPPPSAGPAAKAGDEVKTEFFSLKIPAGWIMPYPVNNKPDGTSAVFGDEKSHVTVTINAIKAPLTLKAFTDIILPSMKKSGLKPGIPVLENGLYKVVIRGKPQGEAWFGSNGKLCTATVILNENSSIGSANDILQAIQSPTANLFPRKLK